MWIERETEVAKKHENMLETQASFDKEIRSVRSYDQIPMTN